MNKKEALETLKEAIRSIPFTPNAQKRWNRTAKEAVSILEDELNINNVVVTQGDILMKKRTRPTIIPKKEY